MSGTGCNNQTFVGPELIIKKRSEIVRQCFLSFDKCCIGFLAFKEGWNSEYAKG